MFDAFEIDTATVQLPPSGLLVLCSDGLTEPVNQQNQLFGEAGLLAVVQSCRQLPAQEICQGLWQAMQDHSGQLEQQDDFTLVVVKRIG